MSTLSLPPELEIEPALLSAVLGGTQDGLSMADVRPTPLGVSRKLDIVHPYTVLVGLSGKYRGSLHLNMSAKAACFLAGQMLCEEISEISDDVLDGIGEIGNLVAGGIQAQLRGGEYEVDSISVPSLIVGNQYTLHNYRKFSSANVEFELSEMASKIANDQFVVIGLSLMPAGT